MKMSYAYFVFTITNFIFNNITSAADRPQAIYTGIVIIEVPEGSSETGIGIEVRDFVINSPADMCGINIGDKIIKVNKTNITSSHEYRSAINSARKNNESFLMVELSIIDINNIEKSIKCLAFFLDGEAYDFHMKNVVNYKTKSQQR